MRVCGRFSKWLISAVRLESDYYSLIRARWYLRTCWIYRYLSKFQWVFVVRTCKFVQVVSDQPIGAFEETCHAVTQSTKRGCFSQGTRVCCAAYMFSNIGYEHQYRCRSDIWWETKGELILEVMREQGTEGDWVIGYPVHSRISWQIASNMTSGVRIEVLARLWHGTASGLDQSCQVSC